MISSEQITKFRELYKTHFGKELSIEEAYQSAAKLLRLVELIYKPMTQDELKRVQHWESQIRKEFPNENEA